MAVTFVSTGGVTLAGGILPRIVDFLDEAVFRQAFEGKAPVDALARRIPTRLLVHCDAVLAGMAAIAAAPDRYGIEYSSRRWVTPCEPSRVSGDAGAFRSARSIRVAEPA